VKECGTVVEVDGAAVQGLLERARTRLTSEDHALLERLVQSWLWLTRLVREGRATVVRLRRLFGLSTSEKTKSVLGRAEPGSPGSPGGSKPGASGPPDGSGDGPKEAKARPKKARAKGHGRRPAAAYETARHVAVHHETLSPGDRCPLCGRGTLFDLEQAAVFLRIVGQAPLCAVSWDCQRLRCSGCGEVHTATAPAEAQGGKYACSAVSMIALLRFGSGMPHHRLARLQADLQVPIPASTQWEMVAAAAGELKPVFDELARQAAQGTLLHHDDSYTAVLSWMGKRRLALLQGGELPDPERTGLFTTAVVSVTAEGRRIALFFTGRKHGGENLAALLARRDGELPPPVHMSDALSCNNPAGHAVIACHCLSHARRNFVDEVENFPEECRYVLELIGRVFKIDEICREEKLSGDERLRRHQRESVPVMEELEQWMRAQLEEKRTEPNSGLGKAIRYLLKRWDRFTLFLRRPGVPLDNNISERALKMAIRHRNNSLFYRSQHGAEVGDLYMSLIHTAELCGENPFDYLTALQLHAPAVAEAPASWLPWNWRDARARGQPPQSRAA